MSRAETPLTFRIYHGDSPVREVALSQSVIKIGKLSSSHLCLDDDTVSRMHAVIEVSRSGQVSIIDLGSARGTYVNSSKINKATLRDGDELTLGSTRIVIAMGASASDRSAVREPAAPRPRPAALATPAAPMPPVAPVAPVAPATVAQPRVAAAPPPVRVAAPRPPVASVRAVTPTPVAPTPVAPVDVDATSGPTGERSVEVAAMLGDSVVGVKHLGNPRSGTVTRQTWALFVVGAVLVTTALAAFVVAVENADFNEVSRTMWLAKGHAISDWRPRSLSWVYDWMAFGGASLGLLSVVFGLLRVRDERRSPYFSIGSDAGVDFATSHAPASSFPLVAPQGDQFVVNFTDAMTGDVIEGGRSLSLTSLREAGRVRPSAAVPGAYQVPVTAHTRIKLRMAGNAFMIASVPRPRRHAVPLFSSIGNRALAYMAGSALVHLSLLGILNMLPSDPHSLVLDMGSQESPGIRVEYKPNEDDKQPPPEAGNSGDSGEDGRPGTAMTGEEGVMGTLESSQKSGHYKLKDRSADPQISRERAISDARRAGPLSVLGEHSGDLIASLNASGDFSSGHDELTIYGGLQGDDYGEASGNFGFGRSGFGPGGGGPGWGTLGTGRYDTIGDNGRYPGGIGLGTGRPGGHGRRPQVPSTKIHPPVVGDGLDKNIIRRYVRRQIARIQYCYEKQLLVHPGMSGTVVAGFHIKPDGGVLNSTAKGMNDQVSSCVADVISTIQFPKPKMSSLVHVRSYPFTFRPTGG